MDFNEICRTCLCSGTEMLSLFDENRETLGLLSAADILKMFTSLSIDNKDDLPEHICISCFSEIHRTYSFKLKCEKSESILLQLKESKVDLTKIKSENTSKFETCFEQPWDTEEMLDDNDLITNNTRKNPAELNEKPRNSDCAEEEYVQGFKVIIKNEPVLDVDDIGCIESDEQTYKVDNEETSKFEQSTTHLPPKKNELLLENRFHLRQELMKRSSYACTQLDHPPSPLNEFSQEITTHLSENLTKQSENIEIEPNQVETIYESKNQEEATFSCSICPNEMFEVEAQLDRHNLRVHTEVYGINCPVCSVRFSKQTDFILHMSIVHNCEKPYECELCGLHYRTKHALRHHLRAKHPKEISAVNVFVCEICSKILPYQAKYNEHMRGHTGAKTFQCKLCSDKFRYRYSLVYHMRTKHVHESNDGQPEYKCSVCSKIFGFQYSLVNHMRIHTREEPFQCKVCSIKFRHSQSLICHMRRKHANELSGGKPEYQCKICSKIFGFNNRLVRHMHTHTGEKPYVCKLCPEKFRYSYALKTHMERKHSNEVAAMDQ